MTTDDPDPARCDVPANTRRLRVAVTDGRGRPRAGAGLADWLVEAAPRSAVGEVVVALVGDRKMRDLNRRFRGLDKVTDVLSFATDPAPAGRSPVPAPLLGDVVIATGRAARQARAAGQTNADEWRRLALHGLLHLLGYDHEQDDGQMERLERRLRRRAGLSVD
ncbi:MAG: rRNA maturation RNase YbeY [Acidobacteria bacterium]|nr:rRNA maturation RNase YbeY [Acidobacteriota bacterium]